MNHDRIPPNVRQAQNARKRMLILLACAVLHAALERYQFTFSLNLYLIGNLKATITRNNGSMAFRKQRKNPKIHWTN